MSGAEEIVAQALRGREWPRLSGAHHGGDPFTAIRSACAIAVHMNQPLTPAGGEQLRTAALIGNLQYMSEHLDCALEHLEQAPGQLG